LNAGADNQVAKLTHIFGVEVFPKRNSRSTTVGHKAEDTEAFYTPLSYHRNQLWQVPEIPPHCNEVYFHRDTCRQGILQREDRRREAFVSRNGIVRLGEMGVDAEDEPVQATFSKEIRRSSRKRIQLRIYDTTGVDRRMDSQVAGLADPAREVGNEQRLSAAERNLPDSECRAL